MDVGLVFLLLTLNIFHTFFYVSIVDIEQVNVSWEVRSKKKRDKIIRKRDYKHN